MQKKDKKPKKLPPSAHRRPVREKFDIEKLGQNLGPSLLDAVRELHRSRKRREYITQLCQEYGCSEITVDRAIAAAEREWAEEAGPDRPRRIARKHATYERLAQKAEDAGDHRAAAYILKQADELLGDRAPKRIAVEGFDDDEDPDVLQAEADRLRALAKKS